MDSALSPELASGLNLKSLRSPPEPEPRGGHFTEGAVQVRLPCSVSSATALGSGHDPGLAGSWPALGSQLLGESASPTDLLLSHALSHSFSLHERKTRFPKSVWSLVGWA